MRHNCFYASSDIGFRVLTCKKSFSSNPQSCPQETFGGYHLANSEQGKQADKQGKCCIRLLRQNKLTLTIHTKRCNNIYVTKDIEHVSAGMSAFARASVWRVTNTGTFSMTKQHENVNNKFLLFKNYTNKFLQQNKQITQFQTEKCTSQINCK